MTSELTQALSVVAIIAMFCTVLAPMLCWILPNKTRSA